MLESVTSAALASALDGLALRQRAIANNIANVKTPNYHAKRVQLRGRPRGRRCSPATGERPGHHGAESLEPTRLNGNNVNLDTETLSNVDTVLRYQFAARAVDHEFTARALRDEDQLMTLRRDRHRRLRPHRPPQVARRRLATTSPT